MKALIGFSGQTWAWAVAADARPILNATIAIRQVNVMTASLLSRRDRRSFTALSPISFSRQVSYVAWVRTVLAHDLMSDVRYGSFATEPFRANAGHCLLLLSQLNRSTQHFIVEGKDRECRTIGQ